MKKFICVFFIIFLKLWTNKVYNCEKMVGISIILKSYNRSAFIRLLFEPKLVFLWWFLPKLWSFISAELIFIYRGFHGKCSHPGLGRYFTHPCQLWYIRNHTSIHPFRLKPTMHLLCDYPLDCFLINFEISKFFIRFPTFEILYLDDILLTQCQLWYIRNHTSILLFRLKPTMHLLCDYPWD